MMGGQFPCTTWSETRHSQSHAWERYGEWIAGYVSAASMEKGLARTNNQTIFGFVDAYCRARPSDTLAMASEQFVVTLEPGESASATGRFTAPPCLRSSVMTSSNYLSTLIAELDPHMFLLLS